MTTIRPNGIAIFCDDLRQEVGGKVTVVGIYDEILLFPGPAETTRVPQICVWVTLQWPKGKAPGHGGEVEVTLGVPKQPPMVRSVIEMPGLFEQFAHEPDERLHDAARLAFRFPGLQIKDGAQLIVEHRIGGRKTKLGRLLIKRSPPEGVHTSEAPTDR